MAPKQRSAIANRPDRDGNAPRNRMVSPPPRRPCLPEVLTDVTRQRSIYGDRGLRTKHPQGGRAAAGRPTCDELCADTKTAEASFAAPDQTLRLRKKLQS